MLREPCLWVCLCTLSDPRYNASSNCKHRPLPDYKCRLESHWKNGCTGPVRTAVIEQVGWQYLIYKHAKDRAVPHWKANLSAVLIFGSISVVAGLCHNSDPIVDILYLSSNRASCCTRSRESYESRSSSSVVETLALLALKIISKWTSTLLSQAPFCLGPLSWVVLGIVEFCLHGDRECSDIRTPYLRHPRPLSYSH